MRLHHQQPNNIKMKKYLIILLGIFLLSFVSAVGMPYPYKDYDGDLVLNWKDNCYFVYNPFQTDSDIDGYGDVCDSSPFGYCGDNFCLGDESATNCPVDCETPIIPPSCGDEICNGDENFHSCPVDCRNCSEDEDDEDEHSGYHPKQFCEPNWKCGDWSSCDSGIMTRKCYDASHCSYSYNQPNEITGCEISEKVFVEKGANYVPLFVFLGLIGIVLLGILVGVLARE